MVKRDEKMVVVFLILSIATCFCLTLDPTTADAAEPETLVLKVLPKAIKEWEISRGCKVTPAGAKFLAEKMTSTAPALEAKTAKYKLTFEEQTTAAEYIVAAYLDYASLREFGPERIGCSIDGGVIKDVSLPPVFTNPDTGILDIDGAQKGADIFINGDKKGSIRQSFVLSVGTHVWKTMKCEEKISVKAHDIVKRYCGRK